MHHNDKFCQSVLGSYCTEYDLVDGKAYDKENTGTQMADDNTKATSVPQ